MILKKQTLVKLINEGKAQYTNGTEQQSIIYDDANNKDSCKQFVAVDRLDLQRVDHYEI